METIPVTVPLSQLLFFVALGLFSLHISVVSYHWYYYTEHIALAHKIVFSYLAIGLVCLGTFAWVAFI